MRARQLAKPSSCCYPLRKCRQPMAGEKMKYAKRLDCTALPALFRRERVVVWQARRQLQRGGKKEGNEIPCATRDAAVKPSVAEFVQMLTEDKKGSTDCRSQNDKAKTLTGTIVKCFLPIQTNICTNILWYHIWAVFSWSVRKTVVAIKLNKACVSLNILLIN